jgi:hypothetical protein
MAECPAVRLAVPSSAQGLLEVLFVQSDVAREFRQDSGIADVSPFPEERFQDALVVVVSPAPFLGILRVCSERLYLGRARLGW